MSQYDIQLSQYNSAAQEIARTDDISKRCHDKRRKGKLIDWNYELDGIWLELSGDKNLHSNDIKRYYYYQRLFSKYRHSRSATYQVLLKKEMFLRKLQNRLGKGTKYQQADDSGF